MSPLFHKNQLSNPVDAKIGYVANFDLVGSSKLTQILLDRYTEESYPISTEEQKAALSLKVATAEHQIKSAVLLTTTTILSQFNATILNHTGDGVLCVFEGLQESELTQIFKIRKQISTATQDLGKNIDELSKTPLAMKMGLYYGAYAMGSYTIALQGGETRTDYTANGVSVNGASRMVDFSEQSDIVMNLEAFTRLSKYLRVNLEWQVTQFEKVLKNMGEHLCVRLVPGRV